MKFLGKCKLLWSIVTGRLENTVRFVWKGASRIPSLGFQAGETQPCTEVIFAYDTESVRL